MAHRILALWKEYWGGISIFGLLALTIYLSPGCQQRHRGEKRFPDLSGLSGTVTSFEASRYQIILKGAEEGWGVIDITTARPLGELDARHGSDAKSVGNGPIRLTGARVFHVIPPQGGFFIENGQIISDASEPARLESATKKPRRE